MLRVIPIVSFTLSGNLSRFRFEEPTQSKGASPWTAIYVLHCFQKKSRRGIETPKPDVDAISACLKLARLDYEGRHGDNEK